MKGNQPLFLDERTQVEKALEPSKDEKRGVKIEEKKTVDGDSIRKI